MRQLVYTVFCIRYHAPFSLWQTKPVLKCIASKYYDKDCSWFNTQISVYVPKQQFEPEGYVIYVFIMERSGTYSYISLLISVLSKLFQELIGTRPAEF